MKTNEVRLTLKLKDGRSPSVVCDYMSAVQRIAEARRWPLYDKFEVEGPAKKLVESLAEVSGG